MADDNKREHGGVSLKKAAFLDWAGIFCRGGGIAARNRYVSIYVGFLAVLNVHILMNVISILSPDSSVLAVEAARRFAVFAIPAALALLALCLFVWRLKKRALIAYTAVFGVCGFAFYFTGNLIPGAMQSIFVLCIWLHGRRAFK